MLPRSRPARGAWIEICQSPCRLRRTLRRAPHGARGLKCSIIASRPCKAGSRPARGAWIEISAVPSPPSGSGSRPARGAWIEIHTPLCSRSAFLCRAPHGARGLKLGAVGQGGRSSPSRPARGAWIEIFGTASISKGRSKSRPARGAWIEITNWTRKGRKNDGRAPHGARGLKYRIRRLRRWRWRRAPHGARGLKLTKDQACKLLGLESRPARGAWIEISGGS